MSMKSFLVPRPTIAATAWPATTLEVAVFRGRLSGIVASELFLRGMGNSTYEGQCARLQRAKILGNADNLLKPIIIQQELPVSNLAILQHSLNHIRSMLNQVNALFVNIPKEID